jgi:hypothetical protein
MKMGSAVYDVLEWIAQHHAESTPSISEFDTQFEKSWLLKGPVDHGYADDYKRIGYRLVEFLLETREGKTLVKPEVIKVSFPNGEISIVPDEVTVDKKGRHSIRRIKTGKQRSDEFDDIEYSIWIKAAEQHFGHGSAVEVIHLAGETQEQVTISERKKATRLEKLEDTLKAITEGEFPSSYDTRTCPRCPSFFICGDLPDGEIKIKS